METKELKLTQLGRYINDVNPDIISKAIKEKNKKYQNIKQAIQLLIENFYKDSVDFQKKESWKLSKVIFKNVDKELKNLLTDETAIEDFVSTLNISISDFNLADKDEQEKVKKYVLDKAIKILSSSGKKRKAEGNALIQEKDLTEEKETIEKQIVSTETFKTKIRPLTALVSTNIAVINSVSKSVSMFTLRLRGLSLKLSMIKIKNSFIDKMSKFGRGISSVGRGLKNIGQASLRFIQNIGSSIAFVFNKTIEAIGKAFRFITKMVVGLFVGLFALVKMLVSIVFGAFASLVFGLFSVALSVLKIALTAIIGVLGVLTFVTGFLIRGAFGLAKGILKTVGGLLKKVFAIPIKIIKGIFSNITTLLRSPTFMFVLGLIAGLTMRYIINPLKKNYTKIKTWVVKKYETAKKAIEDFLKPNEQKEKGKEELHTEKSLFDKIVEKIKTNKHFIYFQTKYINPVTTEFNNLLTTIDSYLQNIETTIGDYIKRSVATSATVVVSGLIGKAIGAYFGNPWIGSTVGVMLGGIAASFFEKEKIKNFTKSEDTYELMEEHGLKRSTSISSDPRTLFGLSSGSAKEERKRNIISSAMRAGGAAEGQRIMSEVEAEQQLRDFEQEKLTSALHQLTKSNENLFGLHASMSGKFSGALTTKDETGKLIGHAYNLDVTKSKEKNIEEFQGLMESGLGREGVLRALNNVKDKILKENLADKFFQKNFRKFNFESWFREHAGDEDLSKSATEMFYTMFAYRAFLLAVGANVSRYLRESSSVSDESDALAYLKSMLMFTFNNDLFEKLNYQELFKQFNDNIDTSNSEISKIFKIGNQNKRYNEFQSYLKKIYELKNEDTFQRADVLFELHSLLGHENFIKLIDYEQKMYGMDFENNRNAREIINLFNEKIKDEDDLNVQKSIVTIALGQFLKEYKTTDKLSASALIPENFKHILDNLVINREKLEMLDSLASEIVRNGIGTLESNMDDVAGYEETFYQQLIDKMLEGDDKLTKEEQDRLREVKSLFGKERLSDIVAALRRGMKITQSKNENYDIAIAVLQEDNTQIGDSEDPENPSKAG